MYLVLFNKAVNLVDCCRNVVNKLINCAVALAAGFISMAIL